MSIKFGAVILSAASLLLACETKALTFELDETFNGTSPSSTAPWLTATFTQGAPGTVNLALQSSLNVSSEFFGSLAFNLNPTKNPNTTLNVSQTSGSPVDSISWSLNGENLEGGGDIAKGFDVMIHFVDSSSGRFQGSDLITFAFTGTGLTPEDFDFFNANGEFQIAAHIQGLPNGASGAITGARTDETTVPDGGSTLILLGIATTLFAFVRRAFAS